MGAQAAGVVRCGVVWLHKRDAGSSTGSESSAPKPTDKDGSGRDDSDKDGFFGK